MSESTAVADTQDKPRAIGRPSEYRPEYCEQARKLCAGGFTIQQVADFFGVTRSTIFYWAAHYKEFSDSLKIGAEVASDRVEESLYHRAVGYSHPEEKLFCHEGEVIRAETVKHYPPDTGAMVWWLKNRRPNEWRERTELVHIDARVDLREVVKEYARRHGLEAARDVLRHHGYAAELIEGEFKELEAARTEPEDP